MQMDEDEILVWMVALGEERGATWDWEEFKFDMPEPEEPER